jgi:RNA polymerase sigma-70 factor (ECF subfamily)
MAPKLPCKRYLKRGNRRSIGRCFLFSQKTSSKNLAFEAWSRKLQLIIVWLPSRKKTNFNLYLDDIKTISQPLTDEITDLEEDDLLNLLNHIPAGLQDDFNLFVIEGYGHKEIAVMLNISEGTSKSQLNASKTKLKELVNNLYYQKRNSHGQSRKNSK